MDRTRVSCTGGWWRDKKCIKIFCDTTMFPLWLFCGPNTKLHGVRVLMKHYHMILDTKLGQVTYETYIISCVCYVCKYMLYRTWDLSISPPNQPWYQPVQVYTYWPVLVSFNNWNIITFSNKIQHLITPRKLIRL